MWRKYGISRQAPDENIKQGMPFARRIYKARIQKYSPSVCTYSVLGSRVTISGRHCFVSVGTLSVFIDGSEICISATKMEDDIAFPR
jgi:hypothetical protein